MYCENMEAKEPKLAFLKGTYMMTGGGVIITPLYITYSWEKSTY